MDDPRGHYSNNNNYNNNNNYHSNSNVIINDSALNYHSGGGSNGNNASASARLTAAASARISEAIFRYCAQAVIILFLITYYRRATSDNAERRWLQTDLTSSFYPTLVVSHAFTAEPPPSAPVVMPNSAGFGTEAPASSSSSSAASASSSSSFPQQYQSHGGNNNNNNNNNRNNNNGGGGNTNSQQQQQFHVHHSAEGEPFSFPRFDFRAVFPLNANPSLSLSRPFLSYQTFNLSAASLHAAVGLHHYHTRAWLYGMYTNAAELRRRQLRRLQFRIHHEHRLRLSLNARMQREAAEAQAWLEATRDRLSKLREEERRRGTSGGGNNNENYVFYNDGDNSEDGASEPPNVANREGSNDDTISGQSNNNNQKQNVRIHANNNSNNNNNNIPNYNSGGDGGGDGYHGGKERLRAAWRAWRTAQRRLRRLRRRHRRQSRAATLRLQARVAQFEEEEARAAFVWYVQRTQLRAWRHSDAMRLETLHFLRLLQSYIPELNRLWKGGDPCRWQGVRCRAIHVPLTELLQWDHPALQNYLNYVYTDARVDKRFPANYLRNPTRADARAAAAAASSNNNNNNNNSEEDDDYESAADRKTTTGAETTPDEEKKGKKSGGFLDRLRAKLGGNKNSQNSASSWSLFAASYCDLSIDDSDRNKAATPSSNSNNDDNRSPYRLGCGGALPMSDGILRSADFSTPLYFNRREAMEKVRQLFPPYGNVSLFSLTPGARWDMGGMVRARHAAPHRGESAAFSSSFPHTDGVSASFSSPAGRRGENLPTPQENTNLHHYYHYNSGDNQVNAQEGYYSFFARREGPGRIAADARFLREFSGPLSISPPLLFSGVDARHVLAHYVSVVPDSYEVAGPPPDCKVCMPGVMRWPAAHTTRTATTTEAAAATMMHKNNNGNNSNRGSNNNQHESGPNGEGKANGTRDGTAEEIEKNDNNGEEEEEEEMGMEMEKGEGYLRDAIDDRVDLGRLEREWKELCARRSFIQNGQIPPHMCLPNGTPNRNNHYKALYADDPLLVRRLRGELKRARSSRAEKYNENSKTNDAAGDDDYYDEFYEKEEEQDEEEEEAYLRDVENSNLYSYESDLEDALDAAEAKEGDGIGYYDFDFADDEEDENGGGGDDNHNEGTRKTYTSNSNKNNNKTPRYARSYVKRRLSSADDEIVNTYLTKAHHPSISRVTVHANDAGAALLTIPFYMVSLHLSRHGLGGTLPDFLLNPTTFDTRYDNSLRAAAKAQGNINNIGQTVQHMLRYRKVLITTAGNTNLQQQQQKQQKQQHGVTSEGDDNNESAAAPPPKASKLRSLTTTVIPTAFTGMYAAAGSHAPRSGGSSGDGGGGGNPGFLSAAMSPFRHHGSYNSEAAVYRSGGGGNTNDNYSNKSGNGSSNSSSGHHHGSPHSFSNTVSEANINTATDCYYYSEDTVEGTQRLSKALGNAAEILLARCAAVDIVGPRDPNYWPLETDVMGYALGRFRRLWAAERRRKRERERENTARKAERGKHQEEELQKGRKKKSGGSGGGNEHHGEIQLPLRKQECLAAEAIFPFFTLDTFNTLDGLDPQTTSAVSPSFNPDSTSQHNNNNNNNKVGSRRHHHHQQEQQQQHKKNKKREEEILGESGRSSGSSSSSSSCDVRPPPHDPKRHAGGDGKYPYEAEEEEEDEDGNEEEGERESERVRELRAQLAWMTQMALRHAEKHGLRTRHYDLAAYFSEVARFATFGSDDIQGGNHNHNRHNQHHHGINDSNNNNANSNNNSRSNSSNGDVNHSDKRASSSSGGGGSGRGTHTKASRKKQHQRMMQYYREEEKACNYGGMQRGESRSEKQLRESLARPLTSGLELYDPSSFPSYSSSSLSNRSDPRTPTRGGGGAIPSDPLRRIDALHTFDGKKVSLFASVDDTANLGVIEPRLVTLRRAIFSFNKNIAGFFPLSWHQLLFLTRVDLRRTSVVRFRLNAAAVPEPDLSVFGIHNDDNNNNNKVSPSLTASSAAEERGSNNNNNGKSNNRHRHNHRRSADGTKGSTGSSSSSKQHQHKKEEEKPPLTDFQRELQEEVKEMQEIERLRAYPPLATDFAFPLTPEFQKSPGCRHGGAGASSDVTATEAKLNRMLGAAPPSTYRVNLNNMDDDFTNVNVNPLASANSALYNNNNKNNNNNNDNNNDNNNNDGEKKHHRAEAGSGGAGGEEKEGVGVAVPIASEEERRRHLRRLQDDITTTQLLIAQRGAAPRVRAFEAQLAAVAEAAEAAEKERSERERERASGDNSNSNNKKKKKKDNRIAVFDPSSGRARVAAYAARAGVEALPAVVRADYFDLILEYRQLTPNLYKQATLARFMEDVVTVRKQPGVYYDMPPHSPSSSSSSSTSAADFDSLEDVTCDNNNNNNNNNNDEDDTGNNRNNDRRHSQDSANAFDENKSDNNLKKTAKKSAESPNSKNKSSQTFSSAGGGMTANHLISDLPTRAIGFVKAQVESSLHQLKKLLSW